MGDTPDSRLRPLRANFRHAEPMQALVPLPQLLDEAKPVQPWHGQVRDDHIHVLAVVDPERRFAVTGV